jgi:phosphatidylserine synthase
MIVALYVLVGFPAVGLLAVALVLAGLMVSDIQYPKVRNTITLAVVGALLLLILLLYAIGTSYWIISAVLLLLSIVYVLNPLYRRYFR